MKWACTVVQADGGRVFVFHFTLDDLPTNDGQYTAFVERGQRACYLTGTIRTMELRPVKP